MDISLLWDFFREGQWNKIERIADTRKNFLSTLQIVFLFFWRYFLL